MNEKQQKYVIDRTWQYFDTHTQVSREKFEDILNAAEKVYIDTNELSGTKFEPRDTLAMIILEKLNKDIEAGICFSVKTGRDLEYGHINIEAWYGMGDPSTVGVKIHIEELEL